jgi:hypothetical protein
VLRRCGIQSGPIFSGNGNSCGVLCGWVRWGVEKLPVAGFAQKKADFFLFCGVNSDHLWNNLTKTRGLYVREGNEIWCSRDI